MDEMRADCISAMGDELGTSFHELHRKLVELHVIWQQYRQLFGDTPDTVHLLNRTAGLFFRIVQDELWDSVLLGISRMTDPPNMGKKRNLTILSLPPLITDRKLKTEIDDLCATVMTKEKSARDHRDKRIAHQDHDYLSNPKIHSLSDISRETIECVLASLRDVLNHLENHFMGSRTMYENFIDESGARLLVHKLEELEKLQKASYSIP